MTELIATEETGTQTGRQIGPIAPRAHQRMQPALGRLGVGRCTREMRIGILAQHLNRTTSLINYSWKPSSA
jgi:hypothetical protein